MLNNFASVFVVHKGVRYDCDLPLPRVFRNHASCKKFLGFIGETILKRLSTGAVKVWGRVKCDIVLHYFYSIPINCGSF